ncbi:MAG: glycosyltransferase [Candidatus Bathyarchaeia archaeon]
MVVPSRQDNLPNTAVEAQACGTPVVAFHIGRITRYCYSSANWLSCSTL